jgi:hypothetical protein
MPPSREAGILGNRSLTYAELDRQFGADARVVTRRAGSDGRPDATRNEVPLFAVAPNGQLRIAADGQPLDVRQGETLIAVALAAVGSEARAQEKETAGP